MKKETTKKEPLFSSEDLKGIKERISIFRNVLSKEFMQEMWEYAVHKKIVRRHLSSEYSKFEDKYYKDILKMNNLLFGADHLYIEPTFKSKSKLYGKTKRLQGTSKRKNKS